MVSLTKGGKPEGVDAAEMSGPGRPTGRRTLNLSTLVYLILSLYCIYCYNTVLMDRNGFFPGFFLEEKAR